jgi:septum formation protein
VARAEPLLLASKSASRRALLEAAGVPVEIEPADIDERAIETQAEAGGPGEVARLLAREKPARSPRSIRDGSVLGADQTWPSARTLLQAEGSRGRRDQLRAMRGQTHELHSGIAVVRDGAVLFEHVSVARMTMRAFSEDFLQTYLDTAGPAVTPASARIRSKGSACSCSSASRAITRPSSACRSSRC